MRLARILAIVAMAGSVGIVLNTGEVQAQIREQQPAEFPPSTYKGKQYVDSQGCVFIRAGIDGNVSWVPRVSRDRKTVCGFKPSISTQVAAASAPAPAQAAPVQITIDTPAAAPAARPAAAPASRPAPAPAARRVASVAVPAPAAAPKRRAAPVVVRQTAPRRAPAPQIVAPAPRIVQPVAAAPRVAGGCQGASAISAQYLRGEGVRCGTQSEPIIANPQGTSRTYASGGQAVSVSPTTRIVPKHVAENRVNTRNVTIPKGYREVWTDGRLNPYRAEQNLAGRAQMALVWTNTLPRRLINQATGRDVTAKMPLIYPYTSVAQQRANLGEVTLMQRNGKTVKRIVRNPGVAPVTRQPVYSTRSKPKAAAPAKPAKALAGKRYVQVGTFRNSENAQRAAQRIARMGMPARIGKHRKGGQTYMTVQAGPFNGAQSLQGAMRQLRGAGYSDAFAR